MGTQPASPRATINKCLLTYRVLIMNQRNHPTQGWIYQTKAKSSLELFIEREARAIYRSIVHAKASPVLSKSKDHIVSSS